MALTCEDILKLIPPYIDGEFTDSERDLVESHVSTCDDCRRAVAAERSFKAGLRAKLSPPNAPGGLAAKIAGSLDAADRTQDFPAPETAPVVLPWMSVVAAAAAIAVFAFVPGARSVSDVAPPAVVRTTPTVAPTRVASIPGTRSVGLERVRITVPTSRGPKALWVEAFDPRTVPFQQMQQRQVGRHKVWLTRSGRMTRVVYRKDGKAYSMSSELGPDELLQMAAHELGY